MSADRFWQRVDRSAGADACWPWNGPRTPDGYGKASRRPWKEGTSGAHRVAWFWHYGEPPTPGMTLDHLCENKICCNPSHLELVTSAENTRRKSSPFRFGRSGELRAECPNGHDLTSGNLAVRPDGSLKCRQCHAEYMRAWNARRRAAS